MQTLHIVFTLLVLRPGDFVVFGIPARADIRQPDYGVQTSVLDINMVAQTSAGSCGRPAITPDTYLTGAVTRIIGGREVRGHSWPWMVSLQRSGRHWCGGSLLSEQWVLTAAHCTGFSTRHHTGTVMLGAHSISLPEKSKMVASVDDVIPHPEYRLYTVNDGIAAAHDVMLVHLTHPVPLSDVISPVCLPRRGWTPFVGQMCYTTGWGRDRFEWSGGEWKSTSPDLLQQLMMPVLADSRCNSSSWYDGAVHHSMFCAGYQQAGRGNCHYDSGGPLVCENDHSWYLTGIVSWADPCARTKSPTVYTDVKETLDWIYYVTENYH